MKEKWEELEELLTDDTEITVAEAVLTVVVAFLLGLVLGMIFSPKKHVTIGSNNILSCEDDEEE